MNEPIEHFCEMMASLSERDQHELVSWSCMALGRRRQPTGVIETRTTPDRDLYHAYTIDDLRQQLYMLIDEVGLSVQLIIDGLFYFLLDLHEHAADRDSASDGIDRQLGMIESLKAELRLPVEERSEMQSDEEIHGLIAKIEGFLRTPNRTTKIR